MPEPPRWALVWPNGNTGAASSRARRIFRAGNPLRPSDLQKPTTDPALTPHLSASSEIDWVMNCSGSSRIAFAICRCVRLRVGDRPRIHGKRLLSPLRVFRDGDELVGLSISSFLAVDPPLVGCQASVAVADQLSAPIRPLAGIHPWPHPNP